MQEALIKTYRYVGRHPRAGAFRPWLYRTVRNACLMGRRKRVGEPARLQSLDEVLPGRDGSTRPDAPDPGKNPEQLADNAGLRRRLRKALRTLPGPYRAVVFLREMEGLSTREVAKVMGMSEDNVKTRLHRARLQLQAKLGSDARMSDPTRPSARCRSPVSGGVALSRRRPHARPSPDGRTAHQGVRVLRDAWPRACGGRWPPAAPKVEGGRPAPSSRAWRSGSRRSSRRMAALQELEEHSAGNVSRRLSLHRPEEPLVKRAPGQRQDLEAVLLRMRCSSMRIGSRRALPALHDREVIAALRVLQHVEP